MLAEKTPQKQNVVIALTLACLFFSPAWVSLSRVLPYFAPVSNRYLLSQPFKSSYFSVLLLVSLFTLLLFALLEFERKATRKILSLLVYAFLLSLLFIPANTLRHDLAGKIPSLETFSIRNFLSSFPGRGLTGFFIFATTYSLWKSPTQGIRAFRAGVLLVCPFAALKGVQCLYGLALLPAGIAPHPQLAPPKPKTRIVWMLFDEMEENLTFVNRPPQIHLPELDRLAQGAFTATQAYPPGDKTMLSLPSYITGETVNRAVPIGANDLQLGFPHSPVLKKWSELPGIFSESKKLGANTALVGSYHPYCRIPNLGLDSCSFFRGRFEFSSDLGISLQHWIASFLPGSPDKDYSYGVETMVQEFQKVASDPTFSLAFAHWPFPHSPWMFDPSSKKISSSVKQSEDGYLGNLLLVDQTLGAIRRNLEINHLWDKTIVIVTSDHWWREYDQRKKRGDHRIPLMIKAENQISPQLFTEPLNAILIHDLILDILKSPSFDQGTLLHWISTHPSFHQI